MVAAEQGWVFLEIVAKSSVDAGPATVAPVPNTDLAFMHLTARSRAALAALKLQTPRPTRAPTTAPTVSSSTAAAIAPVTPGASQHKKEANVDAVPQAMLPPDEEGRSSANAPSHSQIQRASPALEQNPSQLAPVTPNFTDPAPIMRPVVLSDSTISTPVLPSLPARPKVVSADNVVPVTPTLPVRPAMAALSQPAPAGFALISIDRPEPVVAAHAVPAADMDLQVLEEELHQIRTALANGAFVWAPTCVFIDSAL
jgi:hypothetical protein